MRFRSPFRRGDADVVDLAMLLVALVVIGALVAWASGLL